MRRSSGRPPAAVRGLAAVSGFASLHIPLHACTHASKLACFLHVSWQSLRAHRSPGLLPPLPPSDTAVGDDQQQGEGSSDEEWSGDEEGEGDEESEGEEDIYHLLNHAAAGGWAPGVGRRSCKVRRVLGYCYPSTRHSQHSLLARLHRSLKQHSWPSPTPPALSPCAAAATFSRQLQTFPLLRDWTPPAMQHELASELR